jgi:CIC family chloride channel protein
LFIGALLGAGIGGVQHVLFPHLSGSSGTYALVGMGVLFAGFLRAPMTSVFMVLEVSGNYSIIVPVIVANTFAYVISRWLQPTPIFDVLTRQDGLDLPSMEEQREADILRVEDALLPNSPTVADAETAVNHVLQDAEKSTFDAILVRVGPAGWSSTSKQELRALIDQGKGDISLGSVVGGREIPYLHPDQALETALRYVYECPIVPVVSRANIRKLEGVVTQQDVLNRYRMFRKDGD